MTAWLKAHTANLILLILGVAVLVFTTIMIWLYILTGGIPDTLCTCFFAAVTGECGFMGWIKTTKTKQQEREWKAEDERAADKKRLSTLAALAEQEAAANDSNRG